MSQTSAESPPAAMAVRRAGPEDMREIVVALTRAFDDDPVLNWIVSQDERRRRRIARIMEHLAGRSLSHDELWTTEGTIRGAACWVPPHPARRGDAVRQLLGIPAFGRTVGWRRLRFVMRGMSELEARHPKDRPHFYLPAIGVAPEHQGQGLGSILLRAALDRCDARGIPAYLESSKEENVPLYERHGFAVTEVVELPEGPPVWLMWREPA